MGRPSTSTLFANYPPIYTSFHTLTAPYCYLPSLVIVGKLVGHASPSVGGGRRTCGGFRAASAGQYIYKYQNDSCLNCQKSVLRLMYNRYQLTMLICTNAIRKSCWRISHPYPHLYPTFIPILYSTQVTSAQHAENSRQQQEESSLKLAQVGGVEWVDMVGGI